MEQCATCGGALNPPVEPVEPQKPESLAVIEKMIKYKKLQRVCTSFVIGALLGFAVCVLGYILYAANIPDVSLFMKDWCTKNEVGQYVGIHMDILNSQLSNKFDINLYMSLLAVPFAVLVVAVICACCPVKKLNHKKIEKHRGAVSVIIFSVLFTVALAIICVLAIKANSIMDEYWNTYYQASQDNALQCYHSVAYLDIGLLFGLIPQCVLGLIIGVCGIISGISLRCKKIIAFECASADYSSDAKGNLSTANFKTQKKQYKSDIKAYKKAYKSYKRDAEIYTMILEKKSIFTGGAFANWGVGALTALVSLITLGIAYPFMACFSLKWRAKHTYIDGRRQVFDGNGLQLWGKYLLWLLLSVITFGIYYIICAKVNLLKWQTKHTHFEGEIAENTASEEIQSEFDGKWYQLLGVNWLCNFVTGITLGLGACWAFCYKIRWECKHKTVDGERLCFDGKAIQFFGKCLLWSLLTVITLGIYVFWLKVKTEKWKVSHTHIAEAAENQVNSAA